MRPEHRRAIAERPDQHAHPSDRRADRQRPVTSEGSAATYRFLIMSEEDLMALVAGVVAAVRGEVRPRTARAATRHALPTQTPPSRAGTPDVATTDALRDLTRRELEVVDLVAQGLDNRAIAAALAISHRTVRNHLNSIFSKLGVSYRPQVVILAREAGLGHRDGAPWYSGPTSSSGT